MSDLVYEVGGFSFNIRGEKWGDQDIINEVFVNDVYKLRNTNYTPRVIYDIGGHIGSFGVLAKTMWPNVKLIHVEPNLRSIELAKKNLSDFDDVHFINGALKYDDVANVYMDDDRATGGGSMVTRKDFDDNFSGSTYYIHTENVELYTMEKLMEKFDDDEVDVVKLDCECGERDFFTGLSEDTAPKIKQIVGEYHYKRSTFIRHIRRVFPDFRISFAGEHDHIGTFWGIRK